MVTYCYYFTCETLYPTHHFEHVIESLVGHIEANGGSVRLNHLVTDFVLENDHVTGVSAMVTSTQTVQSFKADIIVSNMDPRKTADD